MSSRTARTALTLLALMAFCCLISLPIHAEEKRQPPAWAKTLTPSQRDQVEHMHHELDDEQAPFKKTEAQTLKELNEMTIREDVALADVNAKIDELMAAKTQIMRLRYDHLIEMRRVLSDEQKASYDEGVLKRSAVR